MPRDSALFGVFAMSDQRSADPMTVQDAIDVLRALTVTIEGSVKCTCKPSMEPLLPSTGHQRSCDVDKAVRFELASAGIV